MNLTLAELWGTMSWFPKGIIFVLLLMSLISLTVAVAKWWRFYRMGKATKDFAPEFSSALESDNISEAVELTEKHQKSHVARVLGNTLEEVIPLLNEEEHENDIAVTGTERSVEREQILLADDLKSGLGTLATIGSTAPFVGLLGTVVGVINAFTGMAMKGGGIAAISAGIAEALVTTAAGLLVAIPAVWLYNYFNTRLDSLFSELSSAGRELTDWVVMGGEADLENYDEVAASNESNSTEE